MALCRGFFRKSTFAGVGAWNAPPAARRGGYERSLDTSNGPIFPVEYSSAGKEHHMSQLLILDIDDAILERLRERAAHHAQSVEVEAKAILAGALQPASPADPWSAIDAMRENLARSGQEFPDSAPLVREDRDR
jgi:plasmid stability protein